MKDWTKTNYGTPKSWGQVQQERRDEELAKNSSNPFWALAGICVLAVIVIACLIGFILSFVR